MDQTNELFRSLILLIRTLRGDNGCPWDQKQTTESLKVYLQQEFQELMEALEEKSSEKIQEEMGDLIFLLLFVAEIAREQGDFSIEDVLENVKEKMIRRHPHVFGNLEVKNISQIRKNWKKIKEKEKLLASQQTLMDKLPRHLPVLLQAYWAMRKVDEMGLNEGGLPEAMEKAIHEMEKFRKSLANGDHEKARYELGDLLLTLVRLSRLLKVNPEEVVKEAVQRFINGVHFIEKNPLPKNEEKENFL